VRSARSARFGTLMLQLGQTTNIFLRCTGIFNNGYTYQSHAVSCRAGIEVIKILREENLLVLFAPSFQSRCCSTCC